MKIKIRDKSPGDTSRRNRRKKVPSSEKQKWYHISSYFDEPLEAHKMYPRIFPFRACRRGKTTRADLRRAPRAWPTNHHPRDGRIGQVSRQVRPADPGCMVPFFPDDWYQSLHATTSSRSTWVRFISTVKRWQCSQSVCRSEGRYPPNPDRATFRIFQKCSSSCRTCENVPQLRRLIRYTIRRPQLSYFGGGDGRE